MSGLRMEEEDNETEVCGFFFFFFNLIFKWRIIALQYCDGFLPYMNMNQP